MGTIDFAAGCVGGVAGVFAGHPLDTVKVRLQTQTDHRYRGTFHCLWSIGKREGVVHGLYKGLSSPLAGLTFINAIVFGTYGNVVKLFKDPSALHSHFVAGCCAGFAQSFIASPMELVKLRVQIQRDPATISAHPPPDPRDVYRSSFHCARVVWEKTGIRGLFRGLSVTIMRDCPAFGLYFVVYEWLARRLSVDGSLERLTAGQLLFAGGMAGTASWFFNYPTDVVKTRYQADHTSYPTYRNLRHCTWETYRTGGLRAFSCGLSSTLMRAFFTNATTFFGVEWTFRLHDYWLARKEKLKGAADQSRPPPPTPPPAPPPTPESCYPTSGTPDSAPSFSEMFHWHLHLDISPHHHQDMGIDHPLTRFY